MTAERSSVAHPAGPKRQTQLSLAVATALCWWLAGALGWFWLGWVCLVPFFVLVSDLSPGQRWKWGYLCGFLSFWLINWWLIPTITRGAPAIGLPPLLGVVLGVLSVTIIAAGHALLPAWVALVWYRPGPRAAVLATLVWVLGDLLRTRGQLSHSWGALGFSQTADLALLNALPHQHLLTAFCVLMSALLALWWRSRLKPVAAVIVALLVVTHATGAMILATPLPPGRPWRALLVQTQVGSLRKTVDSRGETAGAQALRLTLEQLRAGANPDLVVWPETTSQLFYFDGGYRGLDYTQWTAQGFRPDLLMGATVEHAAGTRTNEAILIPGQGSIHAYQKSQLVPFGERAPFSNWLAPLQLLAPRPPLEAGAPNQEPVRMAQPLVSLVPLICFESCFPVPQQRLLRQNPDSALVVLTNDEWFTGTEVPAQHRAMAILRAVENRRTLLQSANGGHTFAVDGRGRVRAALPPGQAGVLSVNLP